jgi:hypothetical protein
MTSRLLSSSWVSLNLTAFVTIKKIQTDPLAEPWGSPRQVPATVGGRYMSAKVPATVGGRYMSAAYLRI